MNTFELANGFTLADSHRVFELFNSQSSEVNIVDGLLKIDSFCEVLNELSGCVFQRIDKVDHDFLSPAMIRETAEQRLRIVLNSELVRSDEFSIRDLVLNCEIAVGRAALFLTESSSRSLRGLVSVKWTPIIGPPACDS